MIQTVLLLLLGVLWTTTPTGRPKARRAAVGAAKRKQIAQLPDPDLMSDAMLEAELRDLMREDEKSRRRWACDRQGCNGRPHLGWRHKHARASQRLPDWVWTTWLLLTGRGWGKTRTAAEAVRVWAQKPNQFIAVVAKNETLVREICFESKKSGLLSVIPAEEILSYSKSTGNVHMVLKNGTIIRGFGGEVPDNLRGWAFDKAWADEYAAWNRHTAQDVMDMLWFCLREAAVPQIVISTTPKPLPHIIKLVKRSKAQQKKLAEQAEAHANGEADVAPLPGPRVVVTQGHTDENRDNLSEVAVDELEESYGGQRIGEQELGGILLEDIEGALWKQWMFEVEGFRVSRADVPAIDRMVIAVDPATTTTETADESGICVMGRGPWLPAVFADQRPHGYVFAAEAHKLTPIQTMTRAAELYHLWKADAVILEANNGGEYLATVLRMIDPTVNYRIVHASRDKRARATPVAGLYETARMHHVGMPLQHTPDAVDAQPLAKLESVMTTYVGAPEKDEKSPDILDAHVWAATDLFLDPTAPNSLSAQQKARDRRSEGRR
jgi:phage terminase large subunit-like protein